MVEPSAELDDLAHRVIGAAIEVHRLLGPGFLESVYEEALCVELALHDIPFARQVPIGVRYKGEQVGEARLDLLVHDSLVVELKTVESIAPIQYAIRLLVPQGSLSFTRWFGPRPPCPRIGLRPRAKIL